MVTDLEGVYRDLAAQLLSVWEGERDFIANAGNFSALLYHGLPELNWAGFYRWTGSGLLLGPFQGQPACVRIADGRGVCGAAVARRQTVLVPDVHAFPGHIACDPASRSEIVVPLIQNQQLLGVLDLDSPRLGRFERVDQIGLEALVRLFLKHTDVGPLR